jgi:inorganic pyrophosphatase
VLALVEEPSFSGCLIEVRPIGMLHMVDQKKSDQKILAVPNDNPRYDEVHDLDQIFTHIRHEIEHFFTIYKELEGRPTATLGWGDLGDTHKIVLKSRENYLKNTRRSKSKPRPKRKPR